MDGISNEDAGRTPLSSFPVIRSRNVEQVRDALIHSYGARWFNLPHGSEGFIAHANHWQSASLGLSYCSYGTQVELEFPAADFFRQQGSG